MAVAAIATIAALCVRASKAADEYPSRAITLVVPFAAGGPTDVVARIAAAGLSTRLGQQVIVENVGGAGGTIGAMRVARAAPDGYTMLLGQTGTHAFAVSLYSKLPYDPLKDFETIGNVANAPQVILTKKPGPANSLEELAAFVKANDSKLNIGHAGVGSTSHVACLLFNLQVGANPNYVPYRGTSPALNDLIGGQIDYMCDQITNVVGQAKGGTVQVISIFGPKRSPALPEIPTAAEAGMPGLDAVIWNGLFFPKGTPQPIIEKMSEALAKTLDDPMTQQRLADLGADAPAPGERGPIAFRDLVKREVDRWTPIIKGAGVQVE
ncbi:tripartite tricarboxylate transporter substrate binding protein [Bradyrhizobium sp. Cp5.3]|uniref:Bug family tripartite tricarboxylate transporter substrate binding protein n=1 Tax=Bradyrhizobium sp. Cp5.3 TaxID=443598 RepID=UPI0006871462|nr:tripartite tricarboxylate transporter substrate-binding protein [Bradyrhizobium sp. Cp5.3]